MLPLLNITTGQLLLRTAQKYPSRPAVWHAGKSWSYTQLVRRVRRFAAIFAALGVQKGSRVALWAEPEPDVVAAFYALEWVGAQAVMVNTSLGADELGQMLRTAQVQILCAGAGYRVVGCLADGCETALRGTPVRAVYTVGERSAGRADALSAVVPPRGACKAARQLACAVVPQDTAVLLFTSGSTSAPKAVLSSHFSRVNSGIQQARDMGVSCVDSFCMAMPMFHCFCMSVNLFASLAAGACLCIPRDRHTESILQTVEQRRCTVLSSVPTMYRALLANPHFSKARTASLRTGIIGGANYPPEMFAAIEQGLGSGFTLLSSLGQTECTAGLTVCGMDDPLSVRSTTVGHFMDHVEGKIADLTTGAPLPAGHVGEICVRGYLVMQGYCGSPELTSQVLDRDGWLHTGDLGALDAAGYITLAGRLRELIIRGGENISPCEIERVLAALPQAAECKVVGVPDEHFGEEICAVVVCAPGCALTAQEVRACAAARLAYYKVPRYVLFWPSLPRTSTGKTDIKAVAARAARETAGCRQRGPGTQPCGGA